MSDISVESNFGGAYEVLPAGNRGMGAFATRDILPGEIVLVDFTSIVITNGHIAKDCYQIAERYEELEEEEKQEWRNLAGFPWNSRANHYRTIYNLPRPDGLVLPENGEFYTLLNLQFDCNTFAISDAKSALFLKASRFNHSCDPNVWYENSEVEGRWVGRANRHIKQGQELFISYLPSHNPLNGRQKEASNWGFICDCDKCLEMPDEYTASLQEARDIANGIEPDRGWVPPSRGNTVAAMEDQLRRRVTLLREAYDKTCGAKMDDAYGKELVFALWDLLSFHRQLFLSLQKAGDMLEALKHVDHGLVLAREVLPLAATIWPLTHQVLVMLQRDQAFFRRRRQRHGTARQ